MSADYWLGVGTVVLTALIAPGCIMVGGWIGRILARLWATPAAFRLDEWHRARFAASVMVARRCWVVRVPGGWLTYASTVRRDDRAGGQAWEEAYGAVRGPVVRRRLRRPGGSDG